VDPKYLSVRATAAWAALSAVLMIVGAFGPWASFFIFTVNGTDANAGITVLVCALIVGAILGLFALMRATHRERMAAKRAVA
jgi:hypothetical protein